MRLILLALALASLSGCASVQNAGVASYSVRPIVLDGKAVCCEVSVHNGKEYAVLDAVVIKRGEDYEVRLHEEAVRAFKGQELAGNAVTDVTKTAARATAAVLVAPAAAAVGAAAIGAMAK